MRTMALVIPQAMPRYPNRAEPVKVSAPQLTTLEKAKQWALALLHDNRSGIPLFRS